MKTINHVSSAAVADAWLDHSGLNEADTALAHAHARKAESIVALLFAAASALGLRARQAAHVAGPATKQFQPQ